MVFKSTRCLAVAAALAAVITAGEINVGEKKIIGGQKAHPGVFTALVAIHYVDPQGEFPPFLSCEGTLISKWTVLTTGDCVYKAYDDGNGTLSKNLRGRVGSYKWKEGGQLYSFCNGVTHPKYNPATFKYNIGFFYMRTPVVFSQTVHPVNVDFGHVGANVPAIVAGWGVDKSGDVSDSLQQLFVVTVDGARCIKEVAEAAVKSNMNFPVVDPTVEICAVNSKNHGVCSGDGGSTLIRLDRGTIIGHVAWGIPCATGAPDVFARLSAMKEWFLENIRK